MKHEPKSFGVIFFGALIAAGIMAGVYYALSFAPLWFSTGLVGLIYFINGVAQGSRDQ